MDNLELSTPRSRIIIIDNPLLPPTHHAFADGSKPKMPMPALRERKLPRGHANRNLRKRG